MSGPLSASAQLEVIEKLINEAKEKTKGLSPDERDGSFSSVVKAMEIMTARSRVLHDIEKLIQENDAGDVDSKPQEDLPTSIFDSRAHVNRKQADELIKRVRTAAEAHRIFVLSGIELLQLASMLREMDRHLPNFFEE